MQTYIQLENFTQVQMHIILIILLYEASLEKFALSLELNPDNVNAMYFTGRAYHRLGDIETAKTWYNRLIEDYPDTGRAGEAADRLADLE